MTCSMHTGQWNNTGATAGTFMVTSSATGLRHHIYVVAPIRLLILSTDRAGLMRLPLLNGSCWCSCTVSLDPECNRRVSTLQVSPANMCNAAFWNKLFNDHIWILLGRCVLQVGWWRGSVLGGVQEIRIQAAWQPGRTSSSKAASREHGQDGKEVEQGHGQDRRSRRGWAVCRTRARAEWGWRSAVKVLRVQLPKGLTWLTYTSFLCTRIQPEKHGRL